MTKRMLLLMLIKISGLSVLTPLTESLSQPLHLSVRHEDSQVGFSIYKWAVFKEEGRFKEFDGTIQFDPSNFSATKVDLIVQTASVDSRNEGRDRVLRSEDFFHVGKYPTMTFKSTHARALDQQTFEIEGDLTIHGITKRITAPVKVLGVNDTGREIGTLVGFETTFVINREDFKVGEDWHIIGREATIHLLIGAGSGTYTARR
jgi:polyisoprenoid-binding protein YceI